MQIIAKVGGSDLTPPTQGDLDAIYQWRIEAAEMDAVRGEMAFAQSLEAAPSIAISFPQLKCDGRR